MALRMPSIYQKKTFIVGSSSPPDPVPDPVITITETSDSLSEAFGTGNAVVNEGSTVKLSLWLQWTLPKCCLTLRGLRSDEKGATLLNKVFESYICLMELMVCLDCPTTRPVTYNDEK